MAIEREDVEAEEHSVETKATEQSEDGDHWIVSEPVDKFVPPAVALGSLLFEWIAITALPFGTISVNGSNMNLSAIIAIAVVAVVLVAKFGKEGHYKVGNVLGGAAVTLTALWTFVRAAMARQYLVQSSETDMELAMAESIQVSVGIGVWIAVAAGLAMIYVGFRGAGTH